MQIPSCREKLIVNLEISGPDSGPCFVFAHGAGADKDSAFMQQVSAGLAQQGIRVVRFNFPYMDKRLQDGKKRPPDRAPKLIDAYIDVITQLDCPVVIGGKSMGGRMASLLVTDERAAGLDIKGIACLGFPFHAPGKEPGERTDHLVAMSKPMLIVQGTRDAMGTCEEVAGYQLSSNIELKWLEDGNHDLKPRVKSGLTHEQHIESAITAVAEFVKKLVD